MKKQWISVKCGLSRDPKHRRQMGKAVWTYMHMLDLADWETGIVYDWKDENAAEDMGIDIRVLREDRRKLDEEGYISCRQKQYGQDITIHNWTNPREYTGEVYNKKQGDGKLPPSKNAQGDAQGDAQGSIKDVIPTLDSNIKESKPIPQNMPIDWYIQHGMPIPAGLTDGAKAETEAVNEFESALGLTTHWNEWDGIKPEWMALKRFVIARHKEDAQAFRQYAAWYKDEGKFTGGMNAMQIRKQPHLFVTAWDLFKSARTAQESQTEPAKIYRADDEPKKILFVPTGRLPRKAE